MELYIGAFVSEALKYGWDVEVSRGIGSGGVLFFQCRLGAQSWMHVITDEEMKDLIIPEVTARAAVEKVFIKEKKRAQQV